MPIRIENKVFLKVIAQGFPDCKSHVRIHLDVCPKNVPEGGLSDQLNSPASSRFLPWKGENGIGWIKSLW